MTVGVSRRNFLALPLAIAAPARAFAAPPSPVVVELFTSQGCSSCPPADELFGEVRKMPNVIALSYHVSYWDYLGWKDTLGNADLSQRQYEYAKSRGDMDVYTPQVIVDGSAHVVGSKREAVLGAIQSASANPPMAPVSMTDNSLEIMIAVGEGHATHEATLWVMGILPAQTVQVTKGENAGQKLTYQRVVRTATAAGMWNGTATSVKLPKDGVLAGGCKACVALLQDGKVGPILGAAQWGDSDM